MFNRLNRDRQKAGHAPLRYDERLAEIARAHSKDMQEGGFFDHTSPRTGTLEDRLDRAGQLTQVARENLGEGGDVDKTQDALLKSPLHHENIMADDVSHVGIGIVVLSRGGVRRLLVTQVFATPIEKQNPQNARDAMLSRIQAARRKAGLRPLAPHPTLESLAKSHVGSLGEGEDKAASERVGRDVANKLKGSGLRSATVAISVFVTVDIYQPQGAVMAGDAKALAIATTKGRDPRGRPAIKALILVGH